MHARIWHCICLIGLLEGNVCADVFDTSANDQNLADFLTELIEADEVSDALPVLSTVLKAGTKAKAAKRMKTEAKVQAKVDVEAKKTQVKIAAEVKAAEQAKIIPDISDLRLPDILAGLTEAEDVSDASSGLLPALKAETKAKATKQTKAEVKAEAEANAKTKVVEQAKTEPGINGQNLTGFLTELTDKEEVLDVPSDLSPALKTGVKSETDKQTKAEASRIQAMIETKAKAESDEQAKMESEAKVTEQVKLKLEAKAKAEKDARATEQAKIESEIKIAEQAKLESKAKAEKEAKIAEQARIAAEAKATEQAKVGQLEKKRNIGVPEASVSLQPEKQTLTPLPAKQVDVQVSAMDQEKDIFIGDHFKVEHSTLGKERARLLAEINKSLTVELPPVEFLVQPDKGMMQVEKLSLFDATVLAIGYSNDVGASTAKRDASEYQATASLGPLLPHVDYRQSSGQVDNLLPSQAKSSSNQYRMDSKQLTVRQALVDLPSYAERQRQNLLLKSAEHSLSNTQERVAYDTLVSFFKLIQLRLDVVLAKNYEAELNKLLEYMTTRAEAGGSTQADMQRVKGRVINTRSVGIEAKGAYESGLTEFRRLTGVMPSSVTIPESLLPVLPENFETAMATAIQNNYELQAALRNMESVAYERRAIQSKYAPRFDIELSANSTYNTGVGAPTPSANQDDKRAMLTMNWSLFNGGADLMQAKALESKRLEQEYSAKEIQRKLEESLRNNFNALHAVSGRINGVMQEMESNDLVLAAFNEQLFATNRSLLDVLDAYQRQYNSRTELMRLMVAEATAGLQMLRNMGQLQEGIMALR